MANKLYLQNESRYKPEFDLRKTAFKVISHVLKKEGCTIPWEVNLMVTDEEGIREINRQYRNIDTPTDVLSFPALAFGKPADFEGIASSKEFDVFRNPDTGNLMLGDIMISKDRVISQGKEFGHGELREYAFLVAHSVLHLIGYDHMTPQEAEVMEAKQEKYLDDLGIIR